MKYLRQYIRRVLKESPRKQIVDSLLQTGDIDQEDYDSLNSLLNHEESSFRKQGINMLDMLAIDVPEWGELPEDIAYELCSNPRNFDQSMIDVWNQNHDGDLRIDYYDSGIRGSGSYVEPPRFYIFSSDEKKLKLFCDHMIASGLKSGRWSNQSPLEIDRIRHHRKTGNTLWPPEVRGLSGKFKDYWTKLKCN